MMTKPRWILSLLLLLVLTDMAAQSFKLSGGLRELLTEDATVIRRAANQQSRISLLMKVTNARQMAQVCADYDMEMVTDLGHILVTRDDQEFELKAQGWNPL